MPTVLVVDDCAVDRRLVGGILSKLPDVTLQYATDGVEALHSVEQHAPDLVLTDLQMPNMDGLDLVCNLAARFPLVPVILMTGKGSEEIAVRALKAGAASYVPKKSLGYMLADTIQSVLEVAREEETHARLMGAVVHIDCAFELESDFAIVPPLINYLHRNLRSIGACDETTGIRICVALEEALNNAIFHGNLELDSDAREMVRSDYRQLIEDRRRLPPFRDRRLHLDVHLSRQQARFVVRDQGPGFDPAGLPDPTNPSHLDKPSGRGLLLMRTFMDEVIFNGRGNEVTLIKRTDSA